MTYDSRFRIPLNKRLPVPREVKSEVDMVIFTHRGYSSPFVSEFLDGDGFLILFGHIVSFIVY